MSGSPLLRRACLARILGFLTPLIVGATEPATAQRPAELIGRVVEQGGGPVEGARLELVEATAVALTDASGGFRFRAVSAGRYTLRVVRIGFGERILDITLDGGSTQRLDIELIPAPVTLEGVAVSGERTTAVGVRLDRSTIAGSGARSAGDAMRAVPGVVVRSTTPGGPQKVSIRGSAPDAVLVLVDGVVLNDPITGEADLSTVAAGAIESITVLRGAQSARYGPRAEAGVVLIETRAEAGDRAVRASAGSLASRSAAVEWSGSDPFAWTVGGEWRSLGGVYDYTRPRDVGGGERRRENADLSTLDLWAAAAAGLAGGRLRLRGGLESTERGLPGKGYAPSRRARQGVDRLRGSVGWQRVGAAGAMRLSLAGASHEVRLRDPAPPFGLAYDDTAAVRTVDLRAEAERALAGGDAGFGGGLELGWQQIETHLLAAGAPSERLDMGAFGHGRVATRRWGVRLTLGAQLRLDRDRLADDWWLSRSVMLGAGWRGLRAHLANRSSFSPPALGDQFFREAVGVEPNPDLRAERVPSEFEVGVELGGSLRSGDGPLADLDRMLGGVQASLGLTLYRGDIRDMIVWAPDYRFIWSPRNVDVKRRGAELRAELNTLADRLKLTASHAYARITYDRPGDDTVQVRYRPRHTAAVTAGWRADGWRLDAEAHYTGTRYPVPAPVNALPRFWTVAAGAARDWRFGDWRLTTSFRVDRLFDRKNSLIFGFPEPGRVLRLGLEIGPAPATGSAPTGLP